MTEYFKINLSSLYIWAIESLSMSILLLRQGEEP